MDHAGDAAGLVGGEGVHGVDEDGLDALFVGVAQAVVQDGQQEALGLARAGAGGHERGQLAAAAEAGEGLLLVAGGA